MSLSLALAQSASRITRCDFRQSQKAGISATALSDYGNSLLRMKGENMADTVANFTLERLSA